MNTSLVYELRMVRPGEEPARLWGQERGRDARIQIETLLDAAPVGGTVRVDMEGVEVMDVSFSVEVFGKLYSIMPALYPGKALVLEKASRYVRENLGAALEPRGLIALIIDGPRKWDLIGKVSDTDRETLQALFKRKEATTPELAKDLAVNLTTMNQRLRKLSEGGIIIRTKISASSGGEQYSYKWPL